MYDKIYDFSKVRNIGNCYKNGLEPTPRVKFILNLLESESISYELDTFNLNSNIFYNIILRGDSNKMVVAHHDIVNPNSDNANDNSCSIINAIMLKKLSPETNIVLLDGEECSGIGSQHLSDQINSRLFGDIEWVLNFELTGRGGKNFFIGNYPGELYNRIKDIFNCPQVNTPFNDYVIFRKNGIDSCVINPLPISDKETLVKYGDNYLQYDLLFNYHSLNDSLDTISPDDMKEFVEEVVLKIIYK